MVLHHSLWKYSNFLTVATKKKKSPEAIGDFLLHTKLYTVASRGHFYLLHSIKVYYEKCSCEELSVENEIASFSA